MKKICSTKMLLSLSLLLAPACVFAQSAPGCDAPLDGGLSLLVIAGVSYGAKKYAAKKKANNIENNK